MNKKILIIDDIIPDSKYGYGYPRALSILNSAADVGFDVTFIPLQTVYSNGPNVSQLNSSIEIVRLKKKSEIFDYLGLNIKKFTGILISRPKNYSYLADYLSSVRDKPPIIYDVEALNSLREKTAQLLGKSDRKDFNILFEEEFELINKADMLTFVSDSEKKLITGLTDKPSFFLSHFHECKITSNSFSERSNLLFVGGFYSIPCPNVDALLYFISDIFPLIKKGIDIKLEIVGYKSKDLIQQDLVHENPDIIIHGEAIDLYDYYNKAKLVVIPTRIGAGISYKYTEALSYGTPVVTTKLIANQIIKENGKLNGFEKSIDYASKVISLCSDEGHWNNAREIGIDAINRNYKKFHFLNEFHELYKRLVYEQN